MFFYQQVSEDNIAHNSLKLKHTILSMFCIVGSNYLAMSTLKMNLKLGCEDKGGFYDFRGASVENTLQVILRQVTSSVKDLLELEEFVSNLDEGFIEALLRLVSDRLASRRVSCSGFTSICSSSRVWDLNCVLL